MSVHTRSQRLAQAAFPAVMGRKEDPQVNFKEYTTFAKKFPALIHTCGLAQAVAFVEAKGHSDYLTDLEAVIQNARHAEIANEWSLAELSRTNDLGPYMRLSRDAINAASWLKRYVEALAGEDE